MVPREQIQALADEIAAKFAVEKIVLFGSHAYGTPTADSDVDLLVLMEFEGRAFEQSLDIMAAVPWRFSRDIIVRTPADAARRYCEFDCLIRDAFNKGEVLYERGGSRVVGQGQGRLRIGQA